MDNTLKKTDRRVLKTKRAIRNALADLMTQKNYNDITIKEISDKAGINRKTFYNYYRGIYQVIEEIENELIDKLDTMIDEVDFQGYIENPLKMLKKVNLLMNEDLEFYGHLFSLKDGFLLMQKVILFFKTKSRETLIRRFPRLDQQVVDVLLDYIITGTIAVYHQWFNSDRTESLDSISQIISNLAVNGFSSYVTKSEKANI